MNIRSRRALVVAVAALATACGNAGGGAATAGHGEGHGRDQSVSQPVDGAPEATITAVDIDFEPATLELTAGEPTNVTVVNEGDALHDFTLDEAGVHANVPAGDEVTTAVTVDEPGSYKAICTVPGHEDAGMVVDVTVSE